MDGESKAKTGASKRPLYRISDGRKLLAGDACKLLSRDARVFLDWLVENTALNSIADVTAASSQYQISLYRLETEDEKTGRKRQRLSSGAQANKLAAMKRFFLWLWQEGVIVHNPSASIQMPKQPKMLPRNILTPAEAKRLIESIPIEKARETFAIAPFWR
ncbi:MAG: hypothetical protein IPQ00_03010 [Chloracidobacterium sp.]|nr:hypothetical protein [Chloracidobacterium sp.]